MDPGSFARPDGTGFRGTSPFGSERIDGPTVQGPGGHFRASAGPVNARGPLRPACLAARDAAGEGPHERHSFFKRGDVLKRGYDCLDRPLAGERGALHDMRSIGHARHPTSMISRIHGFGRTRLRAYAEGPADARGAEIPSPGRSGTGPGGRGRLRERLQARLNEREDGRSGQATRAVRRARKPGDSVGASRARRARAR